MGKPLGRKKSSNVGSKKPGKDSEQLTSKAFDEDTAVFINMAQELKEEGSRLFQKRDHEGAMLKYEKAIKLLPRNHIDVAYLRCNMAACYMQMGIGEYPRAIAECNLALEVAPKYSKALLKRAKCYEALNRLDLALRDIRHVLAVEPNNLVALETSNAIKMKMQEMGQIIDEDKEIGLLPPLACTKVKKKRRGNSKTVNKADKDQKKVEDKMVVVLEEENDMNEQKVVIKNVKLVLGEDIRWARLPANCTVRMARDIVLDRFPNLKGALLKYRDQEGDLVTITSNDELRLAEAAMDHQGSLKLYIAEVSPDKEPAYEMSVVDEITKHHNVSTKEENTALICIEDWIVQFARYFKNHVGIECDSYLDIYEMGMKLYSEAMEGIVTSEDAMTLFDISLAKIQEMTALALFNWGNIHMSRVRKRVYFKDENDSKDSISGHVRSAFEWACKEYEMAGRRYEDSLIFKPDFYEGLLALGQQQFELAKLHWYYEISSGSGFGPTEPSPEVLELYNKAEDSMERGIQMWEEMEEERLNGLSKYEEHKAQLREMGLDGLLPKDVTREEAEEQATNMRSQIYLLWGTLLYERSVMEYKVRLPSWEECLEVAVEKFELAGASQTDIAVMIKNHNSNDTALEGFKIDEIVQAWNEMYDSNRWRTGVPAFRLEPLFRRRVPHLHSVLETF